MKIDERPNLVQNVVVVRCLGSPY